MGRGCPPSHGAGHRADGPERRRGLAGVLPGGRSAAAGFTVPGAPGCAGDHGLRHPDHRRCRRFHEAVVSSLDPSGAQCADVDSVSRARVRQSSARASPRWPRGQVAIASAHAVRIHTQARWSTTGATDRRQFVTALLMLAFGEQAQAYGAPAAGGSSGRSFDADSLVAPCTGRTAGRASGAPTTRAPALPRTRSTTPPMDYE